MKTRTFFDRFPELETKNLQLTEIKPQHRRQIFHHFSDDAVSQYLDISSVETIEDASSLIDFLGMRFTQERGIRWGIRLKEGADIIGTCGFNSWHKRKFLAELGYDLSVRYQQQGIMSEAANKIIEFGFRQMALQKIEAFILPENAASEALLLRLGFTWEAQVKEYQVSTGQYAYMHHYTLRKHNWLSTLQTHPI